MERRFCANRRTQLPNDHLIASSFLRHIRREGENANSFDLEDLGLEGLVQIKRVNQFHNFASYFFPSERDFFCCCSSELREEYLYRNFSTG